MSYAMTEQSRSVPHANAEAVEAEYDRLRALAHAAGKARGECFDRSREAYNNGDGAAAKQLSEEGKRHGETMKRWNKAASDYIFREENANQRADTIDLHGQYAEEAEDIVEEAIRARKANGDTHLHIIVGKGNHSAGGVMKVRPRVEKVCQELGLSCSQEQNAGVLYVDLTGGNGAPPQQHHQQPQQSQGQHSSSGYPGQQQHQPQHQNQHQNQQHNNNNELEDMGKEIGGKLLKKLEKACCIMM